MVGPILIGSMAIIATTHLVLGLVLQDRELCLWAFLYAGQASILYALQGRD